MGRDEPEEWHYKRTSEPEEIVEVPGFERVKISEPVSEQRIVVKSKRVSRTSAVKSIFLPLSLILFLIAGVFYVGQWMNSLYFVMRPIVIPNLSLGTWFIVFGLVALLPYLMAKIYETYSEIFVTVKVKRKGGKKNGRRRRRRRQ
jgi:hypothetical protein